MLYFKHLKSMSYNYIQRLLRFSLSGTLVLIVTLTTNSSARAAWDLQQTNTAQPLNAVDFYSENYGIAVGESGVARYTTNGGSTWQTSVISGASALLDVSVVPGTTNHAYAVGNLGKIYKTTDGGATWNALNSGVTAKLYSISASSIVHAVAVGAGGVVLKTTDGGLSWSTLDLSTGQTLYAVSSLNQNSIVIGAGAGLVFSTANGGVTWTVSGAAAANILSVKSLHSGSVIWATAQNGTIVRSLDSGTTWTTFNNLPVQVTGKVFYGISGINALNVTAVGENGAIVSTIDGGETWTLDSIETSTLLTDIATPAGQTTKKYVAATSGGVYTYSATAPSAPTNLSVAFVSSATNYSTTDITPLITWGAATAGSNPITDYQIKIGNGFYTSLNNTFNYTPNELSDGQYTVRVRAVDSQGLAGPDIVVTFYVDTIAPNVSNPTPSSVTTGQLTTVSTTVTDTTSGIKLCRLLINNVDQGTMSQVGNSQEYTRTYNFVTADTYNVRAKCTDNAGNERYSATTSVTASSSNVTPPSNTTPSASMSYLNANPTQGVANNTTNVLVTVTVRNSSGQMLANKLVSLSTSRPNSDSISVIANTTNDLGQATFYVRSSAVGTSTYTAVVGGSSVGSIGVSFTSVVVNNSDPAPSFPSPGSLVKLGCPSGADANHICRAVYFVTADGKRHAFPNAKIYASWYPDFSGVITVSAETMASMQLGKNVTYRPGVRMIKFVTSPTVYVIGKNGKLHAIVSEMIAKGLYGNSWNKKIDDLSDAFLGDYWFSNDLNSTSQFTPFSETDSVPTPLYNF